MTAPARAVIFDMDGVLTDSEPAFHAAVNDILGRYGHHIDLHDYEQYIGSATPARWTAMIARFSLPTTLDEILPAYEVPLMRRLRQPRAALPGARSLVERLKARGVPVALCSASYRRWVDGILPSAGLDGLFDVISTADLVPATKPDPAPYAHAAEMLGVAPGECVTIEDSLNGITSALGAGTRVVQLRATATSADPVPGVALVITSLDDFPMQWLPAPH
jgi:HAD superfamily hydrolase (TIGR01509 family)